MRNGDNYPENYRAYLDSLPKGGQLPEKSHPCPNCSREFDSGEDLNSHLRSNECE